MPQHTIQQSQTSHRKDSTTTIDLSAVLDFSLEIAQSAGETIQRLRSENTNQIHQKGSVRDLVTTADLESERIILSEIRKRFPDHNILSEETANNIHPQLFEGPCWVLDPIDGTMNYANNHLQVGISIAFMIDGVTQVGVVHSPFQGETFHAVKGEGAFLNGNKTAIVESLDLGSALVGTGFPYDRSDIDHIVRRVGSVLKHCQDLRRIGAASLDLCWVAAGRLQAFYEHTLSPWDVAAGILIAREAGATIQHFKHEAYTKLPSDINGHCLLASTPNIAEDLLKILRL